MTRMRLQAGRVLMWGRRDDPRQSLDADPASPLAPGLPPAPPATCTPFLWNPANGTMTHTPQPTLSDGRTNANLFCSGARRLTVTGPLHQTRAGDRLQVRLAEF